VICRYQRSQPKQLSGQSGLALEHFSDTGSEDLRRRAYRSPGRRCSTRNPSALTRRSRGSQLASGMRTVVVRLRCDFWRFDAGLRRSKYRRGVFDTAGHRYAPHTILSAKNYFQPLACDAHEAVCAPRTWRIVVVVPDHAARLPAELRTNSDSGPSNLHLTTG
jgi:hypothetical protein